MMATDWIKLDPATLNQPHPADIDGVTVDVLLSPFDVPTAVRCQMVDGGTICRIDLRYLDDEPTESDPQGDGTVAYVGKKSGRLHRIDIPAKFLGGDAVNLRIAVTQAAGRTIESLVEHVPLATRRARTMKGNFRVARDAIEVAGERLMPA